MSNTQRYDQEGYPQVVLHDRLEAGETLTGDDAVAILAGRFSDATHNSYSAEKLADCAHLSSFYEVSVKLCPRKE